MTAARAIGNNPQKSPKNPIPQYRGFPILSQSLAAAIRHTTSKDYSTCSTVSVRVQKRQGAKALIKLQLLTHLLQLTHLKSSFPFDLEMSGGKPKGMTHHYRCLFDVLNDGRPGAIDPSCLLHTDDSYEGCPVHWAGARPGGDHLITTSSDT